MEFEALHVDAYPVDDELADAGTVGPELAHLASVYRRSPRALVWRNPSSEWRLFAVLLPLASRLSLMGNPIFAQLARAWGLNIRFIGVDRDNLAYDFRALLSDRAIRLLIDALGHVLGLVPGNPRPTVSNEALDVLFATLADDLLTVLDKRREDWGRHLMAEHRLEPNAPHSLFDRSTRYPDFLARLREALRDEIINVEFYGRALRSIDLREEVIERRIMALIESSLDPITMAKLARTPAGKHLGAYNWLRIDPRHAAMRAHALTRLPAMTTFFAESLLPFESWQISAALDEDEAPLDALRPETPGAGAKLQVPTLDLRGLAARKETSHSLHWAGVLKRAIDAGQDRAIIESLAQRFAVGDNIIRRVWREQPRSLGQPPAWQLAQILRQLHEVGDRGWPRSEAEWKELMGRAIPAEAL